VSRIRGGNVQAKHGNRPALDDSTAQGTEPTHFIHVSMKRVGSVSETAGFFPAACPCWRQPTVSKDTAWKTRKVLHYFTGTVSLHAMEKPTASTYRMQSIIIINWHF